MGPSVDETENPPQHRGSSVPSVLPMAPMTSYLIETLLTLFAVLALAILVLFAARKVGVGRPSGPLSLLGRLPLEGRRGLYVVKVADVVYVIGASEAGLTKLGEMAAASVPPEPRRDGGRSFSQLLREKRSAPPGERASASSIALAQRGGEVSRSDEERGASSERGAGSDAKP